LQHNTDTYHDQAKATEEEGSKTTAARNDFLQTDMKYTNHMTERSFASDVRKGAAQHKVEALVKENHLPAQMSLQ